MCTLKTIFDPIWATATKILDVEKIDEKHHFTATPIINPFECPFIYLPIMTNMAKSFLKMIVYLLECIRLSLPLLTLAQISSSLFFSSFCESLGVIGFSVVSIGTFCCGAHQHPMGEPTSVPAIISRNVFIKLFAT